ncbi:LPS assembly lipoprotein LptE [Neoroseomonas rubea]|uniref:LPS assembly lipoprotein LptE n=1 Tax=Neoroseomonas rubea TaxID=2748666 RepID=UPI0018DF1337|nr:LPS assembly lipoprotein LptE [Roseomonas rubea]
MSSRRSILVLAPALLAGCGFRPMYAERPDGGGAVAGLRQVRVARILERNGQLMRRRLEERLATSEAEARYDLRVGLAFGAEVQGFTRDGTPTRVRYTGTATWFLFDTNRPPRLVARGAERTFDAFNVPENQFFASDAARQAMEQRLVDQLAEDIVRSLSVRFEAGPPQAG